MLMLMMLVILLMLMLMLMLNIVDDHVYAAYASSHAFSNAAGTGACAIAISC